MLYINLVNRLVLSFIFACCLQVTTFAMASKEAATKIYDGDRYSPEQDPDGDANIKGHDYFAATRSAVSSKVFIFDPNYHAWAVYDEVGRLVNTGKASGGSLYCPDVGRRCTTIVGEFTIVSKGGANCKSSKYPIATGGGAPMPYCMHFGNKGYAIHGSKEIPDDRNVSHGCIRITPMAAKWLNHNFIEIGSKVIVLPYSRLSSFIFRQIESGYLVARV